MNTQKNNGIGRVLRGMRTSLAAAVAISAAIFGISRPANAKLLTVEEFARLRSGPMVTAPMTKSTFLTEIAPRDGAEPVRVEVWRTNLTTDSATGYTNRRDWQSKAMGMGPSFAFATATGTSTAVGTTSMTNSGAAFPTAGQALSGQIVVTASRYGVILSNTATVLTIDQWYDPASSSGAAGSNPATGVYVILPGQNPASWLALTSDAGAAAATDTTLTSEATTNGFARAVGTYAHTAAATTYTLTKTFTAAGSLTVNKEAVFGAQNGGVMPFESAEPTPPALISGDTLTQTVTITIN